MSYYNMKNFKIHSFSFNLKSIIENLMVISVLCGTFMKSDIMTIAQYVSSLIAQILIISCVIFISSRGGCVNKRIFIRYVLFLLLLLFIAVTFAYRNVEFQKAVNRLFPLAAIFGVFIVGDDALKIRCDRIIHNYIVGYAMLSILVNFDFIRFLLTGNAIWIPTNYLGYRCRGMFGDPNFLALYSAAALLMVICSKGKSNQFKHKWIIISTLALNVIFAMSISAFVFLGITIVYHFIITKRQTKSVISKQVVIIVMYFLGLMLYKNFQTQIYDFVTFFLEKIYGDMSSAAYKYTSLSVRLDVQLEALNISLKEWWGQGPLTIRPMLGLDTHNSYIGILFEQGIFGLLLIFVSLDNKCKSRLSDVLGTYLMVSALLLNVHLISLFSLFLIAQYCNNQKEMQSGYIGE